MKKSGLQSSYDWVDFDQLQRTMSRQSKQLQTQRRTQNFDPHKYFGGWQPFERTSIEKIKLGENQFMEMMEYETSSACPSQNEAESIISESLAAPSVADEMEPTPTVPKTNNLFDFKIKPAVLRNNSKLDTYNKIKPVYKSKSKQTKHPSTPHRTYFG